MPDDEMDITGDGGEGLPPATNNEPTSFMATLESSKQFVQLLKSLTFKDRATFFISYNGLKVMVQDSKSMQLSAYFQASFFQTFTIKSADNNLEDSQNDEEIFSFIVGLKNVINCLELFGDEPSVAIKLSYGGYGSPLSIYLDDIDATMLCEVKTYDTEDCADFNFAKSTVLAKVIFTSEQFKDVVTAFQGLNDDITIKITKDYINFRVASIFGDVDSQISSKSLMIDSFICSAPVSAKYSSNMLRQGLKPISFSHKLSIRIDSRDLLCIQHMIEMEEDGGHAFSEIYIVPTVLDDDE